MLPWPARSTDLSPIEHVWDIIGRQRQRHPQPALTVPVLTDQVQQAWNSIPQTDIRHLYDIMHACLHSKLWRLHRLLMYQHFTFEMALLALTLTCDLETLIDSICYLDICIAEISLLYNIFFLVLGFFFLVSVFVSVQVGEGAFNPKTSSARRGTIVLGHLYGQIKGGRQI
ncbi:hypothetical protein AVEN_191706-1 [Araneus ventricosus]|uniref:Tc1-like transposase DDE domain-containing protein n=1 Tax=Araneus ventricosus TaxID=182803 RepID=A0A4Y2LUI2_ARAVE|nr:hypothetical protein AVEN_191706-1 [Araneus ventricosus]